MIKFNSVFWVPLLVVFFFMRVTSFGAAAGEHVKTELYFGLSSPSGQVTDSSWDRFVEQYIAPAFSEGFTVVDALGRWSDNGVSKSERSKLVIYYHPGVADADEKIEQVRSAYISRFDQQAVLRIDIPAPDARANAENQPDACCRANCERQTLLLSVFVLILAGTQVYILIRRRK